ncbi:MAG TPA: zinc-binding dehydrogenase [Vicinamibacterales bacterium]|nr:zinc-binding dehydrogenase [Vicinamibacterales bacterium]
MGRLDQVRAERPSSATSVDTRVRRSRACRARRCRGIAVQGWRCGVRRHQRPIHRWIRHRVVGGCRLRPDTRCGPGHYGQKSRFEEELGDVDVVLDTIGGDTQDRSFAVLKPGGVLVSAVAAPDEQKAARHGVRALFFLVEVSSQRLEQIAALIEAGELTTSVGDVLPLAAARIAHEMLAGKPHKRGKIVLTVDGSLQ